LLKGFVFVCWSIIEKELNKQIKININTSRTPFSSSSDSTTLDPTTSHQKHST